MNMARFWIQCVSLGLLALVSNTGVDASREQTLALLMQKKDVAWVLEKALDAYPPKLGGQSQYEDNYNLTAKCHRSLLVYEAHYLDGQTWPELMMDSDGVPPSGIISGHIHWIGSHEQCLETKATGIEIVSPEHGNMIHDFDAKYCRSYFRYSTGGPSASVGVCLPEHCTRDDVSHILRVDNGSWPVFYTYCGETQKFQNDVWAIVAIIVLSTFTFVVFAATIIDYALEWRNRREEIVLNLDVKSTKDNCGSDVTKKNPAAAASNCTGNISTVDLSHETATESIPDKPQLQLKGTTEGCVVVGEDRVSSNLAETGVQKKKQAGKSLRALLAFSLRRNIPRVLSTRMPPGAYLAFNGIRFLSMAWIVLGHTWQLTMLGTLNAEIYIPMHGAENIYSQYQLVRRWTHCVINNMSLAVDTFLLLGSCLVTISFLKQLDKQNGKPTIRQMTMHYIHRYLRLTPVYAIIVMIFTTLFYHWNTGPLAPESIHFIEDCKTNGWANFLYIQNFYKPNDMCMAWSWYLAIDFQYFVIAPLFVFLIYKFTIPGAVFLFLGYCGALVSRIVLHNDESTSHFADVYVKPWTRFGPYALGIGLGYLLFRTKCKVKMPAVGVVIGWILATVACILAVYGNYNRGVCEGCKPWSTSLENAYRSTYRDLFSFGIAWLMFACCTGYGGIANTFLSWEGFVPVSRLTYVGYLLHPIIIYYNVYSAQRAIYVEDLTMIMMFCAYMTLTLAASFVLTLIFEVPLLELEKIILPARKKTK